MRKNEPKIEIEMNFLHVLKVLLDGRQKNGPWRYPTHVKI